MRKTLLNTLGLLGLGFLTTTSTARAEGEGPIDAIQDAGKLMFKLVDANNDGQISQQEAVDAGNLMVGGFFFRADANGDGVLSKDEMKAAQDSFLAQRPLLRYIVAKNENVQGAIPPGSPTATAAQGLQSMIDTNNDGQLQASELRQFVQTTVAAVFATSDTNRDGQLSPTEVNAAIVGMANAAQTAAFQAADLDRNGQVSMAEFDKAIIEPGHAIFRAVDVNNDGQISPQEAQAARQQVLGQLNMLRVSEPANSLKNLMRTGANPAQVAPIPRFQTTVPGQAAPVATQPAPGQP
jgi:Ca2+-binding EF-hand superfamily protein